MENLNPIGNNTSSSYSNDIIDEKEELMSKEYLGTFRWKRNLKFPKLPELKETFPYDAITKWGEYLERRINFEIEPYIIDALSYPMSIIYSIEILRKKENNFNLLKQNIINIIIMGASNKVEERIALESNYFDEVYYYILSTAINPNKIQVNLYFVGQEIKSQSNYLSKLTEKLKYTFFKGTVGDFLKQNAFEFSKNNTVVIGLNCGFGAGYLKLSTSWIRDLIILLKFNYYLVFTCTNDYEDFKGETAIMKNILQADVKYKIEDNPFKSMTFYKKEDEEKDLWSCGNYGIYLVNGYNKEKISNLLKFDDDKIKELLKKEFSDIGINQI